MSQVRGSPPFQVSPNVNYSWCETDLEDIKFGYVWTIKKFSRLQKSTGERLQSSPFWARESNTIEWILNLYPRGDEEANGEYVSLFLQKQSRFPETTAAFEFSVLKDSPTANKEKANVMKTTESSSFEQLGWPRYIKRDYLMTEENGLLKNDELTICCEVILSKSKYTTGRYDSSFVDDIPTAESNRLADDLGRLLNTKNDCDVVLVAEDQELHAHKNLLGARSSVFNAMFQHDMEENRNNRVVISDIGFNVLEELVRFIYTGKLPDMDYEMLMKLLYAADKYAIEDLTATCDQALSVKLNAENLIQLIPLVSLQNTNHLKARLIVFMKTHTMQNDAVKELWNLIIRQLPQLAAEAFKPK